MNYLSLQFVHRFHNYEYDTKVNKYSPLIFKFNDLETGSPTLIIYGRDENGAGEQLYNEDITPIGNFLIGNLS